MISHAQVRDLRRWWLREREPRTGAYAWAWIGQAGFLVRFGGYRIVLDPYLSNSLARKYRGTRFPHQRLTPIPVEPQELTGADLVFCTHEHTDHMDPDSLQPIAVASPRAIFVVPRFSAERAHERGVAESRCVTLNADETIEFPGGLRVTALPAAHEESVQDESGNHKFLGYLIRCGDVSVYHSGDTIPFGPLEDRLTEICGGGKGITLALLPVNGRDEERRANGVPGNLTADEALGYHRRFGFGTTVLHHFGMFDFNTVVPEVLQAAIDSHEGCGNAIIPELGIPYEREE